MVSCAEHGRYNVCAVVAESVVHTGPDGLCRTLSLWSLCCCCRVRSAYMVVTMSVLLLPSQCCTPALIGCAGHGRYNICSIQLKTKQTLITHKGQFCCGHGGLLK